MGDNYAEQVGWQGFQALHCAPKPRLPDPALRPIEEGGGARGGIEAHYRNLVVGPDRLRVFRDKPAPAAQGSRKRS
ncbi:hypothetical protein ACFQU2_36840 [Siccirubricoccus deserti]